MRDAVQSPDTVHQAATRALRIAKDVPADAIKIMADRVREDSTLRAALLNPLIEYACGQAVGNAVRQKREQMWSQPIKNAAGSPQERAIALAAQNLLLFPLPGGKPLGSATGEDLEVAADFYTKQASDMAHKGRWLTLIKSALPPKKVVSQVFDEAKLRDLQQKAA